MITLTKIKKFIKNIDISHEQDLTHLLILIRKVIEEINQNGQQKKLYTRLKFYCDWPLHNILSYNSAKETLQLDDFPDVITDLKEFKKELIKFSQEYKLVALEKILYEKWEIFKVNYFTMISESSLKIGDITDDSMRYTKRTRLRFNASDVGDSQLISLDYDEH